MGKGDNVLLYYVTVFFNSGLDRQNYFRKTSRINFNYKLLYYFVYYYLMCLIFLVPEGLTSENLMKNPALIAAVQSKLNGLVGTPTSFIDHLPRCVKDRIHALKNIQVECAKLEGKFYEEAHQLEIKYAKLFKPLYEKRDNIVNGKYEPTEEETKWEEPGEKDETDGDEKDKPEEEEKSEEKTEEQKLVDDVLKKLNMDENTKGIPQFWLTAMKNVELLEDMIQVYQLLHLFEHMWWFTVSVWYGSMSKGIQKGICSKYKYFEKNTKKSKKNRNWNFPELFHTNRHCVQKP